MITYAHYVHFVLSGVGLTLCSLLIISILAGTPKNIKHYSILIFYCALCDFIMIVSDSLVMERLMVDLPALFWVANGPCKILGFGFCNYCGAIFSTSIVHSAQIQSISFWYRSRILHKPPPGVIRLHFTVILSSIPSVVIAIIFKNGRIEENAITIAAKKLYPSESWEGAILYGIPDVYRIERPYFTMIPYVYYFLIMQCLLSYMIHTRRNVLRELRMRASTISEKTLKMHVLLIKILTLHAASPVFVIIGVIGIVAMIFGYHHPEMETILFMTPSFPVVINQAVSLWFLKPYRAFVLRLLMRSSRLPRVLRVSTTIYPSDGLSSSKETKTIEF